VQPYKEEEFVKEKRKWNVEEDDEATDIDDGDASGVDSNTEDDVKVVASVRRKKNKKSKVEPYVEKVVLPTRWSLECATLEDWTRLSEGFKDSKKKCEKDLYKILTENFLEIIKTFFEEKVRGDFITEIKIKNLSFLEGEE